MRQRTRTYGSILGVLACGLLAVASFAADPPSAVPDLSAVFGDEAKPSQVMSDISVDLRSVVEDPEWLDDPFLVIDSEMNSVVNDLGDGETTVPARATQPRIIARFDHLIELLEKKCGGGGAAGGMPLFGANASTLGAGPGGQGELRAVNSDGRGMIDLTDRERAKILQSQADGFPAGFDDVLADYFRQLAADNTSATQPDQ